MKRLRTMPAIVPVRGRAAGSKFGRAIRAPLQPSIQAGCSEQCGGGSWAISLLASAVSRLCGATERAATREHGCPFVRARIHLPLTQARTSTTSVLSRDPSPFVGVSSQVGVWIYNRACWLINIAEECQSTSSCTVHVATQWLDLVSCWAIHMWSS